MKSRFNFSKEEKMRLRELVMNYQPVVENKKSDKETLSQKKQAWDRITAPLNCPGMPLRTTAQLRKLWDNIKFRTKHEVAKRKQKRMNTLIPKNIPMMHLNTESAALIESGFNFSEEEEMRLRGLFMTHQPVTETQKLDKQTISQKKQAWDRITAQFNCRGTPLTTAQLKRLWEKMKPDGRQNRSEEDPDVFYVTDNSRDSTAITVDPSTNGSKERQGNETVDDQWTELDELRQLELTEAQLKIAKVEKLMRYDEELAALQKKKLHLEIGLLELKMKNEKKKLENQRMFYTEL